MTKQWVCTGYHWWDDVAEWHDFHFQLGYTMTRRHFGVILFGFGFEIFQEET